MYAYIVFMYVRKHELWDIALIIDGLSPGSMPYRIMSFGVICAAKSLYGPIDISYSDMVRLFSVIYIHTYICM